MLYLGLPSGPRQLMMGEPVASARDLQRYKELLLENRRELSSVQGDAAARVPAAGGLEGDLNRRSSLTSNRRRPRSNQAAYFRSVPGMQTACL